MMATLSRSLSDDSLPRARDPAREKFAITRHADENRFRLQSPWEPVNQMSESRPHSPETRFPSCVEGSAGTRVSFDDLARVPAQRLARLLLERAAEDPTLLSRLYETLEPLKVLRPESPSIVGDSPAMRQVASLVRRFEQTDDPVLITGESGTGKELVARAIHDGSRRAHGPFVPVNCAAIPAGLVASELFGYEKGAFTGAASRTIGQIEYASGGTLFLDEIGDMPIDLQGPFVAFPAGRPNPPRRRPRNDRPRCADRLRHQRAPGSGDRRGSVP